MAGQDAVLSALGPRTKADPICADPAEAVVPAMKEHGVQRLPLQTDDCRLTTDDFPHGL
jgi:hypothetical protein